jgi:hypothetical protein
MSAQSDGDHNRPAEWRKIAQVLLPNQTGCEVIAAEQVQQSLSVLQLPPLLLQKLQHSVYNAVTRICTARLEGEVLLHLFIMTQALGTAGALPLAPAQSTQGEPGWGYFLIERRANGNQAAARHIVELYCYQEGP